MMSSAHQAPRPTLANKIELEEVLYHFVSPILPDDCVLPFVMHQLGYHKGPELGYVVTSLLRPADCMSVLTELAIHMTGADRLDWLNDKYTFSFTGRASSYSSHDQIEAFQKLRHIADKNRADWPTIYDRYNSILQSDACSA